MCQRNFLFSTIIFLFRNIKLATYGSIFSLVYHMQEKLEPVMQKKHISNISIRGLHLKPSLLFNSPNTSVKLSLNLLQSIIPLGNSKGAGIFVKEFVDPIVLGSAGKKGQVNAIIIASNLNYILNGLRRSIVSPIINFSL